MIGKFENEEALLKSYNDLEKEFTKKCQELSRVKKELEEKDSQVESHVDGREDEVVDAGETIENADVINQNEELAENDKIAIKAFLDDVSQILGVDFYLEETSAGSDDLFNLITDVRSDFRAAKQYELSDKIRDELINLGYEIND